MEQENPHFSLGSLHLAYFHSFKIWHLLFVLISTLFMAGLLQILSHCALPGASLL